jgi:hypothetical protein
LEHKTALFDHLRQRWQDLFGASFEVLLYDLTSTYFESSQPDDETDKRRFGHSLDKRKDCVQVVIALIVTPDALPLAYEVLPGSTADCTTLRDAAQDRGPVRQGRSHLDDGSRRSERREAQLRAKNAQLNTPQHCHPCGLLTEQLDEQTMSDIELVRDIASKMLDAYDSRARGIFPCRWRSRSSRPCTAGLRSGMHSRATSVSRFRSGRSPGRIPNFQAQADPAKARGWYRRQAALGENTSLLDSAGRRCAWFWPRHQLRGRARTSWSPAFARLRGCFEFDRVVLAHGKGGEFLLFSYGRRRNAYSRRYSSSDALCRL